ncbi:MAG: glycosyltransferase family 2 protein [Chitinophagaceae bacterium]|nr:glycosyltransferase family 2 protein [Chitinophagaceae bacterium]
MQEPLVAIVILNWNGKNFLQKFLPSVLQSSYLNKKIIVADNASGDGSIAFLKADYPQIEIISLTENHGFAKGYNLALQQVKADYYILLNSDVEVSINWIEPLVSLAVSDNKIAACQPKILSYNNKDTFEYAGAAGGWLDNYCYPFAMGRIFDFCEKDEGQYDNATRIFWASGAALFLKAEAFHAVGGFDPYFFAHQEEIDLCWRLQLSGYKIYSCPQSVVYHLGGGTLPRGHSLKTYLNFRNNHIMMYKNLSGWKRIYTIVARIILDLVSVLKHLLNGDFGFPGSVIKAHFSFFKWIFSNKKGNVFPKNKISSLFGMYRGNLVWEHFILGKKKFSEIVKKQ